MQQLRGYASRLESLKKEYLKEHRINYSSSVSAPRGAASQTLKQNLNLSRSRENLSQRKPHAVLPEILNVA